MMQIAKKKTPKQNEKNTDQSAFLTLHCIDICFNLCVEFCLFLIFFFLIFEAKCTFLRSSA